MSTWDYLLGDDTTGTVSADNLDSAIETVADLADGQVVLRVELVTAPAPTVVRSLSGSDVVLDVTPEGTVVATPLEP